jgi:hypothetical protein
MPRTTTLYPPSSERRSVSLRLTTEDFLAMHEHAATANRTLQGMMTHLVREYLEAHPLPAKRGRPRKVA